MFELWLRRIHMYAALFLIPWVLMYAISTLAMNHTEHLGGPPPRPVFEKALELSWKSDLPDSATPDEVAAALIEEFDMPGRSRVRHEPDSQSIAITGESPLGLRYMTYQPATGMVTVETAGYGPRKFLSQIHYRVGFGWDSLKEDAWGLSVDLFIFAMLFWVVSGLWMWWPIKSTRLFGVLSLGLGIVLFTFFLLAI